jgi:alpha-glucosidase
MYGIFLFYCASNSSMAQQKVVSSPNGKIRVTFSGGESCTVAVAFLGRPAITIQDPAMIINDNKAGSAAFSTRTRTVNQVQQPLIREKRAMIQDHFSEMMVSFSDRTGMIIRVYDDGFAYRFFVRYAEDTVLVQRETATLLFSRGDSLVLPVIRCRDEKDVDCFHTSFEEDYVHTAVSALKPHDLAYLPVYARTANGISMAIAESDLSDYPGMFVTGSENGQPALQLTFPAYPLETAVRGDYFKQELVTRRAGYIAKTAGTRHYPWRVFIMGEHDKDLASSDMVYRLAPDCRLTETDWIRPGQITDEWITNSILYDVDFRSGINTKTYKYYIDFVSRFGMDYVFLDAGWCDIGDFSKISDGMDIAEIVGYGKEKGVGIWLWTSALTLKSNLGFLEQFSHWGIKGIMVDFMDREDQLMIRYLEKVAQETARNRLMVLFHGASKPIGLRKAYPNVINREGVAGHEFNKWTSRITPDHNLIIPFTRMIAGPLDYETGGMINAQQDVFRIVDPIPMTQGTRIHQLAMFVVYDSPLQFMAGNISDYIREPEYAGFYGSIPCVWDETIVLAGKISDYILVARKSGNHWWMAAMTDWTPRSLELDLSFLGDGIYRAEIYQDGINADRYAADYRSTTLQVTGDSKLQVNMAPGGGWIAHISVQ